ncbi:MAG: methyltransferase domain-containing protein, partial [bacterium]|nr:methyltransferase domain-containing protein [bacterium]
MEYGNAKWNSLIPKQNENKYLDESYQIVLDNPNASFSLLSKEVTPNAKVLDVGCSDGKWGRFLKTQNCHVWGMDIDPEALKYLEPLSLYEKLLCCDLENQEQMQAAFSQKECFDFIGCFDVLEHTTAPTTALNNLLPLLKKNGKLLISVPNISNADIFLNLMCGRFNYSEKGILDNTHNKFFTKYSFLQWISDLNRDLPYALDCEYIGGTFGYTEYLEEVKKHYPELYSLIQFNSEFNVIQLLFVLTKKDKGSKLLYEEELKNPFYDGMLEAFQTKIEENSALQTMLAQNNISKNEREDYTNRISFLEKEGQNAKQNWQQCAEQLDLANKSWQQCAEQLDAANK